MELWYTVCTNKKTSGPAQHVVLTEDQQLKIAHIEPH